MKKEKKDKEKKTKEKKAKRPPQLKEENDASFAPAELPAVTSAVAPTGLDTAPLGYALSIVGGKWKLRILWALSPRKGRRYGDIKRDVPEITDMMLSQSLRELTADGLVARTQYQEIPPRVEYAITERGSEVIPAVKALIQWAEKQMEDE